MSFDDHDYYVDRIPAIRQLILDAFAPAELKQFCQKYREFRPLLRQFSADPSIESMADDVIEFCRARVLFSELLAGIKAFNERQYERHYDAIYGSGAAPAVAPAAAPAVGHAESLRVAPGAARLAASPAARGRVFVVHGHDGEAKEAAARCLEKLGLEAIILHEQPSGGRTIIEKFEDYADVAYAVVLLTPDDVGAAKADPGNLKARARQNVILELGFFLGRLGRGRVCALHKGQVEIPSDYHGVLWVRMDADGAWQFNLAREMKAAGLAVDANRLLG